jgi:hypothetical protein
LSEPELTAEEIARIERLRNAEGEMQRVADQFRENMDEVLALLDAETAHGQILDRRTLLNRYPANSVYRYSIHQSSPGSANIPQPNRPVDQIDKTDISMESYSQRYVNNGALDPIRLWFKLGEDVPNDSSNFYRRVTLGGDSFPASFREAFGGIHADPDAARWRTYEPAGSVNIRWNYPGRRRIISNGERLNVWARSNADPNPNQEQDQAVQWALAVNHKKVVVGGYLNDDAVYALQPPNKAWDVNDPDRKALRNQLVILNRLPQVRGQGDTDPQPFNMAKAMIDLAQKAAPQLGQGILDASMVTLPQAYITLLQSPAHTRGLKDGTLTSRMLRAAGVPGDGPPMDYAKEIAFAYDPHDSNEDHIRRLEIEDEDPISFEIPDDDRDISDRLGSVACNSYHVYLACRSIIQIAYHGRSHGGNHIQKNIALDSVVRSYLNRQLEEGAEERDFLHNDGRYVFRQALNNFVEYEFFDFATKAPWVMDRFTSMMKKASGNFPSQTQRDVNNRARIQPGRFGMPPVTNRQAAEIIEDGGGYVNPEYNYYKANYEAVSKILPEAILPNMYIYNLAQGSKGPGIRGKDQGGGQGFTQEFAEDRDNFARLRAGSEVEGTSVGGLQRRRRTVLHRNAQDGERGGDKYTEILYDRAITLDQFDKFTLPLLGNNNIGGERLSQEERASFEEYLERYAEGVKGSNVTIDFTSRLASEFYNQITPSNELDMYANFYKEREYFPMYIEVGIPCFSPLGDLGQLFLNPDDPNTVGEGQFEGLGLSPTNLINSFVSSSAPRLKNFTIHSTGLVASNFESGDLWSSAMQDRTRSERGDDFIPTIVRTKRDNVGLKVYDFDDWVEDMKKHNRTFRDQYQPILSTPNSTATLEEVAVILEAFKAEALGIAHEKLVKYQDLMLTKNKVMCETETIIYKLVKKEADGGEIIQNYFFPNSNQARLIKFIDTQVKYDKRYLYELYAYDIVYGSSFRFRTRSAIYPEQRQPIGQGVTPEAFEDSYPNQGLWLPNSDEAFADYRNEPIHFSFNVETIPNLKIIEYPIYTLQNATALARTTGVRGSYFQTYAGVSAGEMGGVSYPYAKVVDRPPMPPEVSILPYRGDKNRILINLSPTDGALVGDKTVEFIPLVDEDKRKAESLAYDLRQVENYTLPPGHLEFRTEGFNEIKKVEIFRTTELDEMASSMGEMYESFKNKLYKTLDTTLEPSDPSGDYARSFDLLDNILQNQVYYYTFRLVDVHGHASNPTAIHRVKIDSETIGVYPSIEVVNVKDQQARFKKPTKKVTRYLEIKASDIQSMPYVDSGEGDIQTSVRSLVESDTENRIDNNDFLIRITSTDTGRKIDIKTSFKIKQESD